MPEPTWPFCLNDPVRAVHFALEPDCPYGDPLGCPLEGTVIAAITAYKAWATVHPQQAES